MKLNTLQVHVSGSHAGHAAWEGTRVGFVFGGLRGSYFAMIKTTAQMGSCCQHAHPEMSLFS